MGSVEAINETYPFHFGSCSRLLAKSPRQPNMKEEDTDRFKTCHFADIILTFSLGIFTILFSILSFTPARTLLFGVYSFFSISLICT